MVNAARQGRFWCVGAVGGHVANAIKVGSMQQITDLMHAAVERSQANGEIAPHLDPAGASLFLYSFGQGLRGTGRAAKLADLDAQSASPCGPVSGWTSGKQIAD